MDKNRIHVLFVCLGNICRSPMAEGVFRKLLTERGLEDAIFCDSAGTSGFHAGDDPDARMCLTASEFGISLEHKARQFTKQDFEMFDHIVAMDSSNFRNILALAGDRQDYIDKVKLMRDFDPEGPGDVPDPYYGGQRGFYEVYHILRRSAEKFLDQISAR